MLWAAQGRRAWPEAPGIGAMPNLPVIAGEPSAFEQRGKIASPAEDQLPSWNALRDSSSFQVRQLGMVLPWKAFCGPGHPATASRCSPWPAVGGQEFTTGRADHLGHVAGRPVLELGAIAVDAWTVA